MVESFKFDGNFWQPVLFAISLLALFRELGVIFQQAREASREKNAKSYHPLVTPLPRVLLGGCKYKHLDLGKEGFIPKDYHKR